MRAEAERTVLDAGDRAAAGRDLENVHHGDLHRQRLLVAADQRRARGQGLAVIDDAGFGGGAAHVKSYGVVDFQRAAQRLGADHAGGRPRFQHAHALVLGLLGLVKAAGRLHHQERAGEPGLAHVGVDLADIAPHLWADIGVGGDRRAALELAIFLRQFVRRGNEQRRVIFFQNRFRPPLVIGIGVAIEEQDRCSFDAELFELAAQRRDLSVIERLVDLAVGQHALAHFEAQRPLDQRHVFLEEQIIGVRPVDAADLIDVAKAFGDQQRGLGAGALQHRIDGDGRAVQEQSGGAIIAAGFGDAGADPFDQMRRRRQRLAEGELAGFFVEHRDVGERATDISRQPQSPLCHSNLPHASNTTYSSSTLTAKVSAT